MTWTLVLHGGSGRITRETVSPAQAEGAQAALHCALDAGAAVLAADGAALDAVEAAVRVLEDDPHFNAGRGAALTREGVAELDAAIMDGARRAGAVAGVVATRHPVSLARAVLKEGRHVLLSGAGADAFARAQGLEPATQEWLILPERRAQLGELLAGGGFDTDMKYGTVGAVARDAAGHLAAATSTGGVTGKSWGRIGDSPLIGAGTWADGRPCRCGVVHRHRRDLHPRERRRGDLRPRPPRWATAGGGGAGGAGRGDRHGRHRRRHRHGAGGRGDMALHHARHVPRGGCL